MKQFKLSIGMHTYSVRFKKVVKLEGEEVEGMCDFEAKRIEIESGLSKDALLPTYLHEVIHAALFESGLQELAENEPFVETFSQTVARAMRALPEDMK